LGYIAVSNSNTARKVLYLLGENGIRHWFSNQCLNGGAVTVTRSRLDRIRLCDACPGPRYVGEAVDAQGIAFADEECAATILRENAHLRLDDTELEQLLQGRAPTHD